MAGTAKRDSFFTTPAKESASHSKKAPSSSGAARKFKNKIEPNKTRQEGNENKEPKKPFDKKSYRLKKYSNKYKLDKWEDQRRKKVLRNYYKEVKNELPSGSFKSFKFDNEKQNPENDEKSQEETDSSIGWSVRNPDFIKNKGNDAIESASNNKKMDPFRKKKNDAFWKAKQEFQRIKQSKQEKRSLAEKAREEKKKALENYKAKKTEKFKKLNKKTKKGQPVMAGRLEMLFEKIQKSM